MSAKSKLTNSAATNTQAVTSNKQQKTKAAATKKTKGVDTVTANGNSTTTASAADVKTAPRHGKLAGIKKAAGNSLAASRSRSASVMPTGSVDHEAEEKDDDEKEELDDDKLYCVCKTKYDEDRFMIACDRFVTIASTVYTVIYSIVLDVMNGTTPRVSTCQILRLNWSINSFVRRA